eukprot:UN09907
MFIMFIVYLYLLMTLDYLHHIDIVLSLHLMH